MSDSHAMCLSILLQSPPMEFKAKSIFTGGGEYCQCGAILPKDVKWNP